jgi:membrane-associated protein
LLDLLLEWIRAHGVWGVFVFIAIENMGVPWPTELAFIVAVDLVRVGRLPYWAAVAVITLGHLVGSGISYALGRAGDNVLVRRFQRSERVQGARKWLHEWYSKHGALTVFVARLVGQVRPWASVAAGLANVRPGPFAFWTTLGSLLYTVITLELTRVGFHFWDAYPRLRIAGVVALMLIFYGAAVYAAVRGLLGRRAALARRRDSGESEDSNASAVAPEARPQTLPPCPPPTGPTSAPFS